MQRLDVDVIALQEVRLASNPTQRRRLGVAVPVLEAAAAGLEPGELGGLIGWRCLCCCSVSPLGTRSVSGPLCELTRRVGEQVKLTYASEEDKYTRQQTGQYYQVRASLEIRLSRSGESAGTARTPCVTLCALCTHTHTHTHIMAEAGVASSVVGHFCG